MFFVSKRLTERSESADEVGEADAAAVSAGVVAEASRTLEIAVLSPEVVCVDRV